MSETSPTPLTALTGAALVDRLNADTGEIGSRMGIRFLAAGPDEVVATMPVAGNRQPFGLLHGGASVVLAETLGSLGCALAAPEGRVPVGIEVGATHHRGVREGTVTGTATPLHGGRTVASWQIVITDDAGRRVCTARLTCALRDGSDR